MATTSSGRSRRPDLWFVSAAALAAAALLSLAQRDARPAPGVRQRSTDELPATPAPSTGTPATLRVNVAARRPISAADIDRALMSARPGTQDLVLDRMLTTWIASEPQAAARYAELQTDLFLREVAQRTVALRWARIDHAAAESWAESLGDSTERDRVIGAVAQTLGESEPRAALELLARHDGDVAASSRVGVIASWAERDFPAAQTWLEAQPPGPVRDAIVLRLTLLRAQTDPRAAVAFANQLLDDAAARRDALASVVGPWIRRDADAARSWAASTDDETRRRIETELSIRVPDRSPD